MFTLRELEARYDCPIPQQLLDEVEAAATQASAYRAMDAAARLADDIDHERRMVALSWGDIRKLCRVRSGVLVGLVEAHRTYNETGDVYYRRRWQSLRKELAHLLDALAGRKAGLVLLEERARGAELLAA